VILPASHSAKGIYDIRITEKEIMSNLFADERSKRRHMDDSVKDCLASQALEIIVDFEMALSESKRKYPAQEFFAFANAARGYINLTRKDQACCAGMWRCPKGFSDMS